MFIAYLKQKYEGCDYTIGCGTQLVELSATTREEALAELKKLVIGEYSGEYDVRDEGYWNESTLKSVYLYEVSSMQSIPTLNWYNEAIEGNRSQKTN